MNKLALVAALALAGCATKPIAVAVQREAPILPTPEASMQLPYQWTVITRENFEAQMNAIQAEGGSMVVFAMTPEGYRNLNMNMADLRRYIEQQQSVIAGYQAYNAAPPVTSEPPRQRRHWFRIITNNNE